MTTTLRRLFWLALLGGAGYAGWMVWQGRSSDETPAPPEWPPLDPPPSRDVATAASAGAPVAGFAEMRVDDLSVDDTTADASHHAAATWVEPIDGQCPDGYPIKANDNSGIFHVPGGRFYERTVPERCYADAADAEADGYRRAKA
jgi:hypothetical protein